MTQILNPLTTLLHTILQFFYGFTHNWGWAIVLLTILVRVVLIPLTYRQFKSMRGMQQLQPQIKALQEKYKGKRELLNQKMMEFYKENQVNPMGSCLPLVLQMPVFFALFYALNPTRAANAGVFVENLSWLWIRDWGPGQPGWLARDITKFDLILLVFYVASQFLSSLQTTSKDPTQRMMMMSMPVVIGVVMYVGKWPAGLFIYWVTSNLWTVGQQYVITRVLPAPQPAPSATGGTSGRTKERKKRQDGGGKG
jgi:membrane protein insertase, YidC/Oxa1 family, C-terminal domain